MTILARHLGPPCQKAKNTGTSPQLRLRICFSLRRVWMPVCYPSVASGDHGINICMLPDKADQLFVPSEAWMTRIGERAFHPHTGESLWRTDFLQRSREIGPDGVITWRAPGEGIDQQEIIRFARHRLQSLAEAPVAVSNNRRTEPMSLTMTQPVSAPGSTRIGRTTPSTAVAGRSVASMRCVAVPIICAGSGR